MHPRTPPPAPHLSPAPPPPTQTLLLGGARWELRVSSPGQDLAVLTWGQPRSQHPHPAPRLLLPSKAVSSSWIHSPSSISVWRSQFAEPQPATSPGGCQTGSARLRVGQGGAQCRWWGGREGAGAEARQATNCQPRNLADRKGGPAPSRGVLEVSHQPPSGGCRDGAASLPAPGSLIPAACGSCH